MCYLSEGYSMNDLFFSTFAGLRGAVSLALCIVIQTHVDSNSGSEKSETFPNEDIRQVISYTHFMLDIFYCVCPGIPYFVVNKN